MMFRLSLVLVFLVAESMSYRAVLSVAVADLRATPDARAHPVNFGHDAAQLSQALYMDQLEVHSSQAGWSLVSLLQQPNMVNASWGPYRGYIQSNQHVALNASSFGDSDFVVSAQYAEIFSRSCHMVGCLDVDVVVSASFGTLLESRGAPSQGWLPVVLHDGHLGFVLEAHVSPVKQPDLRNRVVQVTNTLLGYPYFWGGRSAFDRAAFARGTQLTGLDCSGLVSIAYKSVGIFLPRDASKQFLKARVVLSAQQLQIGDVFFYQRVSDNFVYHVMMLYDEENIVESSDNSTRIIGITESYGRLPNGALLKFGTFL